MQQLQSHVYPPGAAWPLRPVHHRMHPLRMLDGAQKAEAAHWRGGLAKLTPGKRQANARQTEAVTA